ncbi:post-GPI attachment to proteins factor 2-like isoform X2 [Daktulosphaira vitifoliae]|uniref:post-GPI attachment to proteins factor 2-like isoform X2 n=1 Tax=Daktulosphaira vitifoliae TaxID=58002 RepID=UPI0021A9995F|nr:post-GPI attachment to proteins factor 2-like isoform X2 [Daktulosphaira vitifoliae]
MSTNFIKLSPDKADKRYLIQIKVPSLCLYTMLSVFITFIFCIFWTIWFHLEDSTGTHCGVKNYLPSISTAIGKYSIQQFLWNLAIFAHSPIRLVVTSMYFQYYSKIIKSSLNWCVLLLWTLNIIELCSLVSLSVFTSTNYYSIHEKSFITFISASELNMLISCMLLKKGRFNKTVATKLESKSLSYKIYLTIFNCICFTIAAVCFLRHNAYCETGDI